MLERARAEEVPHFALEQAELREFDVFDLELDAEQTAFAALDRGERTGPDPARFGASALRTDLGA